MKRQQIFSPWYVAFFLFFYTIYALPAHAARKALVIGISKYYDDKVELIEVRNDAKSVADALKNVGFIVAGDQAQLNLKKDDLNAKIADFIGSIQPGDTALFYFSGHGIESELLGENFLISTDGNNAVQVESDILSKIDKKTKSPKIVILDTCRKPSSKDVGLLKPNTLPENSIIAYGSAPQRSIVYPSQYTKKLLSYLQEPGLEITELFRKTRIDVIGGNSELSPQQPTEFGGLTEKFYFRPSVGIWTKINSAADDLSVYINGNLCRNYWNDHNVPIKTKLNPGRNEIEIKVRSNGSHTLSKEKKREGWNYSVDIFNEEEDRTTKITDSEDGEPPDTRFGKDFPAAQGTIFVDPKSGHIDVQVSKTVSNHATNDSTNDSPLAIIGAPFNLLWKSMKSIL